MSASVLTPGACTKLHQLSANDSELSSKQWIMQVLSCKLIPPNSPNNTIERYRAILSDGQHFIQSMLATQLNGKVTSGEFEKNSIIAITNMTIQLVGQKRLVVVLAMETVTLKAEKIGSPVNVDTALIPQSNATPVANQPQRQQQQQQQYAPSSSNVQLSRPPPKFSASIFPIEGLSPYQNNYTLKARVIQKSDIKLWSNTKGEGKLFNCTFADESGEIRATAFNTAVDKFFDKLEEGKVYWVSKGRIQLAKKKFSNVQNEYEMSLDNSTEIEQCHDTVNLPEIKYNFRGLDQLTEVPADALVDVIGVVKAVQDLVTIISKSTNKEILKRDLTIVDRSSTSITITLWGKQAQNYQDDGSAPVIAFKNVKVGDYGGRSLSVLSSSQMYVNPDFEQSHELRGWYDAVGVDSQFNPQSSAVVGAGSGGSFKRDEVKSFAQVKDENIGSGENAEYFSQRATVMHVKTENMMYAACRSDNCSKKIVERGEDWFCEKCNKAWPEPEYRYIMSIAAADATCQLWLQAFNDVGTLLFGMTATELHKLEISDQAEHSKVIARSNAMTFNFSCKAKTETYQEITRVKYGIVKAAPLDYAVETAEMLKLLKSSWAS